MSTLGGAIRTHRADETQPGETIRVATATHTYEIEVMEISPARRPDTETVGLVQHTRLYGALRVSIGGDPTCSAPVWEREFAPEIVVRSHSVVWVFREAGR